MKRHTRDTIRALVRLVEDDVTELRDAVAQVDERCADLRRTVDGDSEYARHLGERLCAIEEYLRAFDHDPHSRKV